MTGPTRPTRPTFETLTTALLTTLVCLAPIACDSPDTDASPATSVASTPVPELEDAPEPAPVMAEATPESGPNTTPAAAPAPMIEDAPVLASTTTPTPTPTPTPMIERRARPADSLRSPGLLPADTPEEHIAAFTNLPLAKRDKAPVAGVGATGIHLDELAVGKGWASSRCEDPAASFSAELDDRVNVCFRVVHPREAEAVSVEWARDGKVRQSIQVNVKPTHAYLTRAWLPVHEGRAGDWSATIKSADGSVLGQVEFQITK